MNEKPGRSASVHSVDRAISILQVLGRLGSAGVTDIAAELDVHKSTVFRLLATLEARGLVEQDGTRGRYRLGYGVVQLAAGATRRHDLTIISRPVCQDLAETVGETVNVAVAYDEDVVSIDQIIGSAAVTSVNWIGQRTPMHATAAGKCFLAWMPKPELDELLGHELVAYTAQTVVDRDELETQLAEIRDQGYAFTDEEHEQGLAAVGAPIRNLDGSVVAAVTVSGPVFRVNRAGLPRIVPQLLAAAAAISERNGFPKPG